MSLREINLVLSDISEVSEVIPLIVGYRYGIKRSPYRMIVWLFFLSAPLKLVSLVTAKFGINNMPLFHFLAICEVVFLYCFFSKVLCGKVKLWGVVILILLNIINTFFNPNESLLQFNGSAWSLNTFVLLCMGLMVLRKLFVSTELIPLDQDPVFVTTSGFMIYFAGSLFIYFFAPRILSHVDKVFFYNAWVMQSVSNILKNSIVSYGLWMVRYE